ncbi:MAG: FAD-binding oxidoreductase [Gaiellales bacterium]|jgi:glycolate oxidase subunit GlcD
MLDELIRAVGPDHVLRPAPAEYLTDATARGLHGSALAVVRPADATEAARVVAACYRNDIAITPRGGGSGVAGGAVPDGGIVISVERLNRIRSFDPLVWRIQAEAGVTTGRLHQVARESGLMFPPDPGASEQSQIGGNLATNAGGPHAFRYGVTRRWVTGIEAVIAPGELVTVGGPVRKDVAGYDLLGLLVGSEGTLGLITAAWLRLVPAPEAVHVVAGVYSTDAAACAAIERILGSGIEAAAIELLDADAMRFGGGGFPVEVDGALVLAEADGGTLEAAARREALLEAMAEGAAAVQQVADREAVWRWRDGLSSRLAAARGGKLSEDIVVPLDRLAEMVAAVPRIGERHGLTGLSFGHAGDGNLHSTFLLDLDEPGQFAAAQSACRELFDLTLEVGGSISGEHGLGSVKAGYLERQWGPAAVGAHRAIKRALDPKGLFNPGKKR